MQQRINFNAANRIGATRFMSSILEQKEHVEEARYIRAMEAQKNEEIRKKLEKILALEDSDRKKQELIEHLDKHDVKEEEQSVIKLLGLNEWKFAIPFGLAFAIPTMINEIVVVDAEWVTFTVMLFVASNIYVEASRRASSAYEEERKEIAQEMQEIEESFRAALKDNIANNENAIKAVQDFQEHNALTDQLAVIQADLLNHMEHHKFREAIIEKLEALKLLEETTTVAIRNRMLTEIREDVLRIVANDKKVKENALNRAIEIVASGGKSPMGKDIIGDVVKQAIVNYREKYAKQPAGSDPILAKLQEDMAAIAAAPEIKRTGGNVYATNPLF